MLSTELEPAITEEPWEGLGVFWQGFWHKQLGNAERSREGGRREGSERMLGKGNRLLDIPPDTAQDKGASLREKRKRMFIPKPNRHVSPGDLNRNEVV